MEAAIVHSGQLYEAMVVVLPHIATKAGMPSAEYCQNLLSPFGSFDSKPERPLSENKGYRRTGLPPQTKVEGRPEYLWHNP